MEKSKKMNDNDLSISGGKDIFDKVTKLVGTVASVAAGVVIQKNFDVYDKAADAIKKWGHSEN